HHEYFTEAADHDIRRLEIAVNDAFRVRVSQRLASLDDYSHRAGKVPVFPLTCPSDTLSPTGGEGWGEGVRFFERVLHVCGFPSFANAGELEDFVEVAALHQFHREERLALRVEANFVHRHDVRMIELRRDLCFFQKACEIELGTART